MRISRLAVNHFILKNRDQSYPFYFGDFIRNVLKHK
jgi:hypothetical protein